MQPLALTTESLCSRCCRRCGRTLRLRHPSSVSLPSRSLHTTSSPGTHHDDQNPPALNEALQDRPIEPYISKRDRIAAEEAANLRSGKLNLSKRFTLAERGAQSGALILKNYKEVGAKRGATQEREKYKLPERPVSDEVNAFAAELSKQVRSQRPRRGGMGNGKVAAGVGAIAGAGEAGAEPELKEVEEQIEDVRKAMQAHERQMRDTEAKKKQARTGHRHERRAAAAKAEFESNVIKLETYTFFHKFLRRTFTSRQLDDYVNNFLASADRSRFAGAKDAGDVLLLSRGIHAGWRPTEEARRQADEELKLLWGSATGTRTKRTVVDGIVRVLWGFEVREEIELAGKLQVKVDDQVVPLLLAWTRQQALSYLGKPPNVTIDLSQSADIVTVTGAKYDCLDAQRSLKARMSEVGKYRLPLDVLRSDIAWTASGKQPEYINAIAQDMRCVVVEHDDEMSIVGASKSDAYVCGQAILSDLHLHATNSYRVTTDEDVAHENLRLLPDPRSTLGASIRQQPLPLGRVVSDRVIGSDSKVPEASQTGTDSLLRTLRSAHEVLTANASSTDAGQHDLLAEAEAASFWKRTRVYTAEIGKVSPMLNDLGNKFPGSPLKQAKFDRALQDRKHAFRFASSTAGLPQLLDRNMRDTEATTARFRRMRLFGRVSAETGREGSSARAPLLELDLQRVSNRFKVIAARLLHQEDVVDVMLPHLSNDVRFTATHQLEMINGDVSTEISDFAQNVMVGAGGWRSPEVLKISVPSSTFTSARVATRERDEPKSSILTWSGEKLDASESSTSTQSPQTMISVDYIPVGFDSIDVITFTYRDHLLEITRVDGGRYGGNIEKATFRYLDDANDGSGPAVPDVSATVAPSSTSSETQDSMLFSDTDAEDAEAMTSAAPVCQDKQDRTHSYLRALGHLARRLDKGTGHLEIGKFGS